MATNVVYVEYKLSRYEEYHNRRYSNLPAEEMPDVLELALALFHRCFETR